MTKTYMAPIRSKWPKNWGGNCGTIQWCSDRSPKAFLGVERLIPYAALCRIARSSMTRSPSTFPYLYLFLVTVWWFVRKRYRDEGLNHRHSITDWQRRALLPFSHVPTQPSVLLRLMSLVLELLRVVVVGL
jgi:hypothetical protein